MCIGNETCTSCDALFAALIVSDCRTYLDDTYLLEYVYTHFFLRNCAIIPHQLNVNRYLISKVAKQINQRENYTEFQRNKRSFSLSIFCFFYPVLHFRRRIRIECVEILLCASRNPRECSRDSRVNAPMYFSFSSSSFSFSFL